MQINPPECPQVDKPCYRKRRGDLSPPTKPIKSFDLDWDQAVRDGRSAISGPPAAPPSSPATVTQPGGLREAAGCSGGARDPRVAGLSCRPCGRVLPGVLFLGRYGCLGVPVRSWGCGGGIPAGTAEVLRCHLQGRIQLSTRSTGPEAPLGSPQPGPSPPKEPRARRFHAALARKPRPSCSCLRKELFENAKPGGDGC